MLTKYADTTPIFAPLTESRPFREGDILERRYVVIGILRPLNEIGAVYIAYDENVERYTVLKLIANPNVQEGKIMAKAYRSGAAQIIDSFLHGDMTVLVMPFYGEVIENKIFPSTLDNLIYSENLPLNVRLNFIIQLSRIIAAHMDLDIYHFDLKPSNIIVDGEIIYLFDYGLSFVSTPDNPLRDQDRPSLSLAGTPKFTTPERVMEVEPFPTYSPQLSEYFSYGLLVFSIFFGRDLAPDFNNPMDMFTFWANFSLYDQNCDASIQFEKIINEATNVPEISKQRLKSAFRKILTKDSIGRTTIDEFTNELISIFED